VASRRKKFNVVVLSDDHGYLRNRCMLIQNRSFTVIDHLTIELDRRLTDNCSNIS